MLGLASVRHRLGSPRSMCVFSPVGNHFVCLFLKYLSFNKLFKLKGSHIKQHSGFEATELERELNREPRCRSKSAKVGTEHGRNILLHVRNGVTDRWRPDILFKGSSWRTLQQQQYCDI